MLEFGLDVTTNDDAGPDGLKISLANISWLEKSIDQLEFGFREDFASMAREEANTNLARLEWSEKWISRVRERRIVLRVMPASL